jgi:hypothetical protein
MTVTSKDKRVRVYLDSECGEGIEGDYRGPKDDILLMRFGVERLNPETKRWDYCDDSSYCTQIPADLPKKELKRLAELILSEVYEPARDHGNVKKLCERLSWINPTWGTKDEKTGWTLDEELERRYELKDMEA